LGHVSLAAIQLDLFSSNLPKKPYCTDDLGAGLLIRCKSSAIQRRYIQHNPPPLLAYMVYDLDRPDSALAWDDAHLPPPAWVSVNPENGHSHIAYGLVAPVARTDAALAAPLRLAAAVEAAYGAKLDADRGYSGLITKNPLHPHWHVYCPATEAANHGYYELAELAEYVTLHNKLPRGREAAGIGRNVSLFDTLRKWSYKAVRGYWRPAGYRTWYLAVLEKANALNCFPEPLPIAEIQATAKSVAKWIWQRFTPGGWADFVERTHTPEIQSQRGKKSGAVRAEKAAEKAIQAQEMSKQGMKKAAIAKALGVTDRTVRAWLKNPEINLISDNSPPGRR
jgi:hypothetical protein